MKQGMIFVCLIGVSLLIAGCSERLHRQHHAVTSPQKLHRSTCQTIERNLVFQQGHSTHIAPYTAIDRARLMRDYDYYDCAHTQQNSLQTHSDR